MEIRRLKSQPVSLKRVPEIGAISGLRWKFAIAITKFARFGCTQVQERKTVVMMTIYSNGCKNAAFFNFNTNYHRMAIFCFFLSLSLSLSPSSLSLQVLGTGRPNCRRPSCARFRKDKHRQSHCAIKIDITLCVAIKHRLIFTNSHIQ